MTQTQSPPEPPAARSYRPQDRFGQRLVGVCVLLGLLGAAWYLMKLLPYVVISLAAAIIIGGLTSYRYSGLVNGLLMLGLAAGAYFYVGHQPLAILLGIFGGVTLAAGVSRLRT